MTEPLPPPGETPSQQGPTPPPGYYSRPPQAPPPQGPYPPAGYPQGPPPPPASAPWGAAPNAGQGAPPRVGYPYPPPQQQPGYGYGPPPSRPPFQAPPPGQIKRSPWPMIIGLGVLVVVLLMGILPIVGLAIFGSSKGAGSGKGSMFAFGDKIGLLEIEGVLGEGPGYGADTQRLKQQVDEWTEDDSIKGMVIRINSPGGAVSATQDLYQAIERFKAKNKPVYASMGDVAASGGYYAAMGADKVYANSGTLTGSIGVILSFYGYQELASKIGIEPRTIKSGQFKDIGAGSRPMTEEEKALLTDMIGNVFEQFFGVVSEARTETARKILAEKAKVSPATINDEDVHAYLRGYCDGRIFSGQQAYEWGFVDEIGTLDDAIDAMRTKLKLKETTPIVPTMKPAPPGLFGKMNHTLEQITPGTTKLEFRFEM